MSEVTRATSEPDPSEGQERDVSQTSQHATLTEIVTGWVRQKTPSDAHVDIASKVTSEHVSQSLEMVDAHDRRILEDRKDQRSHSFRQSLVVTIAVVGSVAILVFSGNAALVRDILQWAIPLVAGAVGGFGWAKRRG